MSDAPVYVVRFRAVMQGAHAVVFSKQEAAIFEVIARRGCAPRAQLANLIDATGCLNDPRKQVDVVIHRIRRKLRNAGIDVALVTRWGMGVAISPIIEIDDEAEAPPPLTVAATRLLRRLIERTREREPLADAVRAAVFGG